MEQNQSGECIRCGAQIADAGIQQKWISKRKTSLIISFAVVLLGLAAVVFLAISGKFFVTPEKHKASVKKSKGVNLIESSDIVKSVRNGAHLQMSLLKNPEFKEKYNVFYAKSQNGFTYYKSHGLTWKSNRDDISSGLILGTLPGLQYNFVVKNSKKLIVM